MLTFLLLISQIFPALNATIAQPVAPMETAVSLVIAPHPDDEVLGVANVMQQKVRDGEAVYVVYLTDGEGKEIGAVAENHTYGYIRRNESITAMKALGVPEKNLVFLGFPDQGLSSLSEEIYTSPYSALNAAPDHARYSGLYYRDSLLKNALRVLINRLHADAVYYTSPSDHHPDHAATGRLLRELIKEHETLVGYEYIVHKKHRRERLLEAPSHPKIDLIALFESQFHDQYHRDYLEDFAYIPEQFMPYRP